jgi:hypothetical protein
LGGKPRESKLTPEMLERFREVGIRLARDGTFWHRGTRITHPRLTRALLRWLDLRPEDGRPILRLDDRRYAYVDVDDSMLLVTSILWRGIDAIAVLNDGTEEPLAYHTLEIGDANAIYCTARDGLSARLTPPAYYSLATRIEERGDRFVLVAGGAEHPIGKRSR